MVLSFLKLAITLKNNVKKKNNERNESALMVMNRQSLYMKFGFLERVRLGHIFLQTIPACHNAANLSK